MYGAMKLGRKTWADSLIRSWQTSFRNGYVATHYGVLRGDGVTERAIFVVDKQGIIRYMDIHDIREQPPTDKIFEALKKLPVHA